MAGRAAHLRPLDRPFCGRVEPGCMFSRRLALILVLLSPALGQTRKPVDLPSSTVLLTPAPGDPQGGVGSLPVSVASSPDGRYLAVLDAGYGARANRMLQGIAVLDMTTGKVSFSRL